MTNEKRDLLNDTFVDVFNAFDHAAAATRLGWPVVFVGWCTTDIKREIERDANGL